MNIFSKLKNSKTLDNNILNKAAIIARGLSIDAVTKAKSGHLGLPLGAAEIGAVLYGNSLVFNPEVTDWINRDRFVLSAGHGSMFLYSWLHLSGHKISLEEIKNFRQLNSITPGHPEFGETPGVETTTGPLGQGVGNAIGMAIAQKKAEALFNTNEHAILDHHIVCLCGDGCMQEGVTAESVAYAGHIGLDNLIIFYDSNDVTLDAPTNKTQSEDIVMRFIAYGFDVDTINGHNIQDIYQAYQKAKVTNNGKPKLIVCKTEIGRGIEEIAGTFHAHGELGVQYADKARKKLGLPEKTFYISEEIKSYFLNHKKYLKKLYIKWLNKYNAWKIANPKLAKQLQEFQLYKSSLDFIDSIPIFSNRKNIATRTAGGEILQFIAKKIPNIISGSADLHGSTKNYINSAGEFNRDNHIGRNLLFGIREHGMGSILNGIAYYGIFRPSGATFLVFSDYMRASIRLSALAKLPIFYIFTHDSIGVGEDGPTHEPIEHISSLRLIPNLDVIRPGDPEETIGAFIASINRKNGPTALILSRQIIQSQNSVTVKKRREGTLRGGYIIKKEKKELKIILIATGSELQHAMEASKKLGENIRVVSMPCAERFDRQTKEYREFVLPSSCKKRVAIEAGSTAYWYRYTGLEGVVVGIDRFGISAPGKVIMNKFGITAENLIKTVKSIS